MTSAIYTTHARVRLFTVRGHNQVMNREMYETMLQIRDVYLPFHFMTGAYTRYPGVFRKRSRKWQMIKARKVHHQRPNEWTGALRRAVLTESIARSTPTRGTLTAKAPLDTKVLFGPRAGQMQRRPLPDWQRDELEHVSQGEIDEQLKRMHAAYRAAVYDPANQDVTLKRFRIG